jgi:hypothetical protein
MKGTINYVGGVTVSLLVSMKISKYLILLLFAARLVEKQQIPIL